MMDHRDQLMPCEQRQFRRVEESLEEDQGLRDTRFAQDQGLVQTGHSKGVGVLQGLSRLHHAVTVGIGFDHSHDAPARGKLANPGQVMAKGGQIEDDLRRTRHP